eukprot:7383191-Prymnesium_polylepis.1
MCIRDSEEAVRERERRDDRADDRAACAPANPNGALSAPWSTCWRQYVSCRSAGALGRRWLVRARAAIGRTDRVERKVAPLGGARPADGHRAEDDRDAAAAEEHVRPVAKVRSVGVAAEHQGGVEAVARREAEQVAVSDVERRLLGVWWPRTARDDLEQRATARRHDGIIEELEREAAIVRRARDRHEHGWRDTRLDEQAREGGDERCGEPDGLVDAEAGDGGQQPQVGRRLRRVVDTMADVVVKREEGAEDSPHLGPSVQDPGAGIL